MQHARTDERMNFDVRYVELRVGAVAQIYTFQIGGNPTCHGTGM